MNESARIPTMPKTTNYSFIQVGVYKEVRRLLALPTEPTLPSSSPAAAPAPAPARPRGGGKADACAELRRDWAPRLAGGLRVANCRTGEAMVLPAPAAAALLIVLAADLCEQVHRSEPFRFFKLSRESDFCVFLM